MSCLLRFRRGFIQGVWRPPERCCQRSRLPRVALSPRMVDIRNGSAQGARHWPGRGVSNRVAGTGPINDPAFGLLPRQTRTYQRLLATTLKNQRPPAVGSPSNRRNDSFSLIGGPPAPQIALLTLPNFAHSKPCDISSTIRLLFRDKPRGFGGCRANRHLIPIFHQIAYKLFLPPRHCPEVS